MTRTFCCLMNAIVLYLHLLSLRHLLPCCWEWARESGCKVWHQFRLWLFQVNKEIGILSQFIRAELVLIVTWQSDISDSVTFFFFDFAAYLLSLARRGEMHMRSRYMPFLLLLRDQHFSVKWSFPAIDNRNLLSFEEKVCFFVILAFPQCLAAYTQYSGRALSDSQCVCRACDVLAFCV